MSPSTTSPDRGLTNGRRARGLRRLIPLGIVLVAAALVGLVALMPSQAPPAPQNETPPANVEVLRIQPLAELADTFDLTAVIEPERVVQVAAEVPGRIEQIAARPRQTASPGRTLPAGAPLEEGDLVSAGDALVHLNKTLPQARFERAQAQFEYDQREFRRILDLFERDVTSKTELDDARTRRDVSKAALDEAAEELARTTIVAPIDGVLNRLPMEVGEYASPGDCVAEIVDVARVKVTVDVPEREVHFLNLGDQAEIFLQTPQTHVLTGAITYVGAVADTNTRTTPLEITIDNRARLLRSGQIVRVRLTRRILKDVIMIPLGAVIPLEDGKEVYVVNGGQAERRLVELGLLKGRSVRVISGLQAGDRLIVAGHRYVGAGQPVNIVAEQQDPP